MSLCKEEVMSLCKEEVEFEQAMLDVNAVEFMYLRLSMVSG